MTQEISRWWIHVQSFCLLWWLEKKKLKVFPLIALLNKKLNLTSCVKEQIYKRVEEESVVSRLRHCLTFPVSDINRTSSPSFSRAVRLWTCPPQTAVGPGELTCGTRRAWSRWGAPPPPPPSTPTETPPITSGASTPTSTASWVEMNESLLIWTALILFISPDSLSILDQSVGLRKFSVSF